MTNADTKSYTTENTTYEAETPEAAWTASPSAYQCPHCGTDCAGECSAPNHRDARGDY